MKEIYMDGAATSAVKPAVVKEMLPFFTREYGNPSSLHSLGEKARKAIDDSRAKLAKVINARPWEIIFTSGSSESNNLAIEGLARANPDKKKIIIGAIEHASIMEKCEDMKKKGYEIVKLNVNSDGAVDLNTLKEEIDRNTLLVSVMHVNNVVGSVQDLGMIGEICLKRGAIFHTDAAQSFGKIKIDVRTMNIGMLSSGAHKIGGPKGAGILYVREGVKIEPLIFGGGQEGGLRGGTENVPAIVGFAKACELAGKTPLGKIEKIRDKMIEGLEKIGGKINGPRKNRMHNNIHVSFRGLDGGTLVSFLSRKGIYVSSGSACESRNEKEDHVLKALGLDKKDIDGAVRITIPDEIKMSEVERAIREIKKAIDILKV